MNNNNKSPFDILGVGRFSTQKEIRRRYLELCKKYHPDVAAINSTQIDFREITVAYELLTNHKKNNHVIASGGVNWEEAKQRSINTRLWTRNSYLVGFTIASCMILYLSFDKLNNQQRERTLLPHERRRLNLDKDKERVFNTAGDTSDSSVPPWQAAGTTFREWRKK